MPTLSLPPSLDFLERPLLDDLSTLPDEARERLHQRLVDEPLFALRMAQALFDMVMLQGSLVVADDEVFTALFQRLAARLVEDEPEALALRHRHLLHAGHHLLNTVHVNDRTRLAQRLLQLNALIEHPGHPARAAVGAPPEDHTDHGDPQAAPVEDGALNPS